MEKIDDLYVRRSPKSQAAFERMKKSIPGGFTHHIRVFYPFPLFTDRCSGAYKWDIDGNKYIDFWQGHGAALLGHSHPVVANAVFEQTNKGFHGGGESELATEWAELICSMVPSIEKVRFTACGGEATQMAIRLARAFTGKNRIVKFQGGFHGWHDLVTIGQYPPWNIPGSLGVPQSASDSVIAVPFNDIDAMTRTLEDEKDIAAVMLEPGGILNDSVPINPRMLTTVREICSAKKIIFICDEVVTGFRYANGGAQEYFGVKADLTTLGKIISGGLPSGAVGGRADIMDLLAAKNDPEWNRYKSIPHPGTWNGMPITAAAGIAMLKHIKAHDSVSQAISQAQKFIKKYNQLCEKADISSFAYGRSSIFKLRPGRRPKLLDGDYADFKTDGEQLSSGWGKIQSSFRKATNIEGLDFMRTDGYISCAHTDEVIEATCEALLKALTRMRNEKLI